MGFIFSEVFWGALLIVLGVLIVLKTIFHLNIPIFPIIIAFILIYAGIRILMGSFGVEKPQNTVLFSDTTIKITNPQATYNVLFSRGIIDLTTVAFPKDDPKVQINTVFGRGIIRINPETAVKIVVNSAFAEATMPDGNTVQFGNTTYQTKAVKEGQEYLLIEANVIFGSLTIVTQ